MGRPCPEVIPNLAAARAESVIFTRAYAAGPKCAPSRTSMLTARYPSRMLYTRAFTQASVGDGQDAAWDGRVEVTVPSSKVTGDDNTNNIAAVLRRAGYHTSHSGKWHIGTATPYASYDADAAEVKEAAGPHTSPPPSQLNLNRRWVVHPVTTQVVSLRCLS